MAADTLISTPSDPAAETRIGDHFALETAGHVAGGFFCLCGMLAAPGHIHPLLGAVALLALAIGAGAAGAINMWYDRDIDAVMRRTQNRPIPAGLPSPEARSLASCCPSAPCC